LYPQYCGPSIAKAETLIKKKDFVKAEKVLLNALKNHRACEQYKECEKHKVCYDHKECFNTHFELGELYEAMAEKSIKDGDEAKAKDEKSKAKANYEKCLKLRESNDLLMQALKRLNTEK
jgi:hypothetical protein